jgi:GAF domain-containing protein
MSRSQLKRDADVVAVMSRVARTMREGTDGVEILQSIAEAALDAVEAADLATICMTHSDGSFTTLASSSAAASEADRVQHEVAARGSMGGERSTDSVHSVRPTSGAAEPADAGRLSRPGIRSELSVEIFRTGSTHAELTLCSTHTSDLEGARSVAELFASQAAIALNFVRTTETLQAALATRQTIGQAIGIIMERYQLDEERAFAYLVRTSQDTNVKLRVVAQQTVETHNVSSPASD